jgi:transketolase
MRTAFVETLIELAQDDPRIYLLTADLGWSVLERFANAFPDRFMNVGVAEQNMLGIASGLAKAGYVPFVYSIATFSSMRCYEQFRNGAVLHQQPVRVIGIGGGFSYGHAGMTHFALEDLTINRTQPDVTVIAPVDRAQTRAVIRATQQVRGPIYLRIEKNATRDLPTLDGRFALGRPEVVVEGNELLLIATGSIAHEVVRAAESLQEMGISAAVAILAHLSFTASWPLVQLLHKYPAVVSVEEGYVAGGLGSLIAETIAQNQLRCRLIMQGVRSIVHGCTGSTEYLRRQHGLDAAGLVDAIQPLMRRSIAS